jgi:hypothetical protein
MIQIIVNNKKEEDISSSINVWFDDTASMIKQKLSSILNISIEEMYLYLETTCTLSPQTVYSLLSKNRKTNVTVNLLKGFVENMKGTERELYEINELDKDEQVPYDFFEKLFTENKEYVMQIPFGLSFGLDPVNSDSNVENIILPTNPYKTKRILRNKFLVLSNNEETLISKLPNYFKDVVINVCSAIETIKSHKYVGVGELVSLYFPKLSSKLPSRLVADSTSSDYIDAIISLRKDLFTQSEILFRSNIKYYKNIDFWNNVNINEVSSEGITSFRLSYLSTPTLNYPLPIEYIFKSIHATERMPFIRYVISKRREQVVRLYAPVEAKDDKRVPYLPKSLVNKILVKSKKVPGVGVFYQDPSLGEDIYIFIELKENGEIQLYLETTDNNPFTVSNIGLLENIINDFVYNVNQILKQTDIILVPIKNIFQNSQITAVDWILYFPFLKPPSDIINNTNTKMGSSVFLTESVMKKERGKKEKEKEKPTKLKTEMEFVYSRVSNFSVDNPTELQTHLNVFYSVDTHKVYMKITNLPNIKYLITVPLYVNQFRNLLTNKKLESEYKSVSNLSTYGYNKQKGEEEFQSELLEELKEKESELNAEDDAEEIDEFDKYIIERMKDIPDSPKENQDVESELGEFELDNEEEEEDENDEDENDEDEDEELGDFDEDL